MVTGKPMFPGTSTSDQLMRIFKYLNVSIHKLITLP